MALTGTGCLGTADGVQDRDTCASL